MSDERKIIYLQTEPDWDGNITWCEDRVNDDDVAYIRKTDHDAEITALRARAERAEADAERLAKVTRELVDAMHRYQMDVEEPAPMKHRLMMERAYDALSARDAGKEK